MNNILKISAAAVVLAICVSACRTSEANYKAAYDKAIAGRGQIVPLDSTIYGKVRREMHTAILVAGGDSAELRTMHVSPTDNEDGTPGKTPLQYGVVAGQFKTLFNARSLCDRLRTAGYSDASIVNTSEPYYYVVASWHTDSKQAVQAQHKIKKDAPVVMREPLPFVLKPASRR